MTSPIDICNRALSLIGTRSTIASFDEGSAESIACAMWYDEMRMQLLRAAPWGFARAQGPLSALGSYLTNTAPWPWGFKYMYPPSCLRVRYVLPPTPYATATVPASEGFYFPFGASPAYRFVVANDIEPLSGFQRRVVLSNLQDAQAVYIIDVTDPDLFDSQFKQALTSALAAVLVISLTGNAGMRQSFIQSAENAITAARVSDGNEAMPSTAHTPDWIIARDAGGFYGDGAQFALGNWWTPWDGMGWGY